MDVVMRDEENGCVADLFAEPRIVSRKLSAETWVNGSPRARRRVVLLGLSECAGEGVATTIT